MKRGRSSNLLSVNSTRMVMEASVQRFFVIAAEFKCKIVFTICRSLQMWWGPWVRTPQRPSFRTLSMRSGKCDTFSRTQNPHWAGGCGRQRGGGVGGVLCPHLQEDEGEGPRQRDQGSLQSVWCRGNRTHWWVPRRYIFLHWMQSQIKDFIEAEELRAIFLQLPEPLSDDEMEEMLRAGNRSGGGTFNLEDMEWGAQIVLVMLLTCDEGYSGSCSDTSSWMVCHSPRRQGDHPYTNQNYFYIYAVIIVTIIPEYTSLYLIISIFRKITSF